jgi:hypothetical protein
VEGQPYPDHEWLTQILFFGVYSLDGMPLLTAVCAAAVTLSVGRRGVADTGACNVEGRGNWGWGGPSAGGWSVRPQAISLALFAVTLRILVRRQHVWALPPLFLIWANLHARSCSAVCSPQQRRSPR